MFHFVYATLFGTVHTTDTNIHKTLVVVLYLFEVVNNAFVIVVFVKVQSVSLRSKSHPKHPLIKFIMHKYFIDKL